MSAIGLLDSGTDPEDPRVELAAQWILDKQLLVEYGDWKVYRPELSGGVHQLHLVIDERHELAKLFETFAVPHVFVIGSGQQIEAQGFANTMEDLRVLMRRRPRSGPREQHKRQVNANEEKAILSA